MPNIFIYGRLRLFVGTVVARRFVREAPSGVKERPWEIDDAVNVFKDWEKTLAKQPTHHHLHSITGTVYWPADD